MFCKKNSNLDCTKIVESEKELMSKMWKVDTGCELMKMNSGNKIWNSEWLSDKYDMCRQVYHNIKYAWS